MSKALYDVIGELELAGVAPGGVVELDDQDTDIPALIEAGRIVPHFGGGPKFPPQGS